MIRDALMAVQDVGGVLMLVGLEPFVASTALVIVFARGLLGLRRVRRQVQQRWASLEAHHQVVMGLEAVGAGDGEWSGTVVGLDGWTVLEDHARRVAWDDVPGRVLAHVVRQAWLAAPDLLALDTLARSGSMPDLERERRTPRTLVWLGVGGAAIVLIAAAWRVESAAWAGSVALARLAPHIGAALAVVLIAVGSTIVFRMQLHLAEQSASRLTDELATLACGPWLDAALTAARSRALFATRAVPTGSGGDDAAHGTSTGERATTSSPNQVDTAAHALLAAAHAIDRLRGDLERGRSRGAPTADAPASDAHLERVVEALEGAQREWRSTSDATVLAMNRVAEHLLALADRLDAQSDQLETARQTLLAGFSDGFRQTGEKVAAELVPAIQMLATVVGRGEGSAER